MVEVGKVFFGCEELIFISIDFFPREGKRDESWFPVEYSCWVGGDGRR